MTPTVTARRNSCALAQMAGFTLVELMIALVLGLVVVGAAIAVFLSNKQAYITNDALSEIQDNSRIAFELMARDIRDAGLTACGNIGRVANVLKNGPNNSGTDWYADFANAIHGYDNASTDPALSGLTSTGSPVSGTNSLQIIGAGTVGYSISSDSGSQFTLNASPDTPPSAGDLIVICDPTHASILQVTGASGSTLTYSGSATPGNCSTNLDYPTGCAGTGTPYTANSQLAELEATDWYIGNNAQSGTSLYRLRVVNVSGVPTPQAQEMVRDVTNLQIQYHVAGAAAFVSAGSVAAGAWSTVDGVQITLRLQSKSKTAGSNAQALQRTVSTVVTLRNRVQ